MIVSFVIGSSSIGCAQRNGTPTITKVFDMDHPGTLDVTSSGGEISVKHHDQKKVEVQAYIRKNERLLSSSDPLLSELQGKFDIIMEKTGSVITVNVNRKIRSKPWQNIGVSFTVLVPYEMSCKLTSHGGGIKISEVTGTHELRSHGGGIKMENITGTTSANTSGGGLKATNQNGDINLKSSGGGITLTGGKGKIYARSSGGSVKLENINGYIDASSSGGSVDITGISESVKAVSSGGSIRMDISGLSKEINLKTSGGGIDAIIRNGENLGLDLNLKSQNVNIDLVNFSGSAKKDRVEGSANGGGIPVYMRTSGGSINVKLE